ncbi:MAG: hypothetical protein ABIH29_00905 [Candidatus Micrarchaeota archaeon]
MTSRTLKGDSINSGRNTSDANKPTAGSRMKSAVRAAAITAFAAGALCLVGCSGAERSMEEDNSCASSHRVAESTNYTSYFREGAVFSPPNAPHLVIEVASVRENEDAHSENPWTGNQVTLEITDTRNGTTRSVTLTSNRGDSVELDGNVSVIAGWAMAVQTPIEERPEDYSDGDPKVEISVVNRNPVDATVTRYGVDADSCGAEEENPSAVVVAFENDLHPLTVEGYRQLETGLLGSSTIANIEIPEEGPVRIALGELEGIQMVDVGQVQRIGREFNVDVSEGDAYDRSNRLWANVGITAVNNSPLLDAEAPEYGLPRFIMNGSHKASFIYTANDAMYIAHLMVTSSETDRSSPAVQASILRVTGELYDGQRITVDGTTYEVGIGLNNAGNAIRSISFTRTE